MAEKSVQLQMVTFQLGEESYALDIMEVKEIVSLQDVRAIPNTPSYVEGIYNLRGEIIPIINLHKRFHIKESAITEEDKLLSGFIILKIEGTLIGIIIDKISRVVNIDSALIQPPPQMISGIGAEYIKGVYKSENHYLILLDVQRLFDPKELRQLSSIVR